MGINLKNTFCTMPLGGWGQATKRRGLDFYGGEGSIKKLPGELTPQLVYLNYLPISVLLV